ncbi:MAG: PqqD family protein [Clostridia bacterium]|nr:PqqD family protein [Clostridia bacterium]
MKKKKIVISKNYLESIPIRSEKLDWKTDEKGKITLEIENTGWANRIAQKLLGKPKVSYVHLDEMGSFLWPRLNGELNIIELGKLVKEEFGEKAEPLYERLARYFQILKSYNFISFKEL